MAKFLIEDTRRLGLDRSEFDVSQVEGSVSPKEIFQFTERGTLWEYVILEARQRPDYVTLSCMNWVPESGAFIGISCTSRPMKAAERRRYEKYLPGA
jgi:hypothetical protein